MKNLKTSFLEQNNLKVISKGIFVNALEIMQPEGWPKGNQPYPAATGDPHPDMAKALGRNLEGSLVHSPPDLWVRDCELERRRFKSLEHTSYANPARRAA